jgi:hypothetical protein
MKVVKVLSEQWFSKAPFQEVKMLAIKHLGIPAAVMNDPNKQENFKRSMARQVFNKDHEYGGEYDILEAANPFGKVPKRKVTGSIGGGLTGEYRFVKCGMRAPEGDVRWQMMKVVEENTTFEAALAIWDKEAGIKTKFKATGDKHTFNFVEMVQWALKRGWIERV